MLSPVVALIGPERPSGLFRVGGTAPATQKTRSASRGADQSAAASGTITAPMQGTVIKVLVTEGQTVAQGDAVLVLEAMKMENMLKSPSDGVISSINIISKRERDFFGIHHVRFESDEMNISISHKALSRNIFAQGAINAAMSLIDKKPGFYDLDAIKN